MSGYFLDMVRGIDAEDVRAERVEQVGNMRTISRQYGETTSRCCERVPDRARARLGGAVAMAPVAVEVSPAHGRFAPFDRARVLIITPEFFLPLDARPALRGSAGRRRAAVRDPRRAGGGRMATETRPVLAGPVRGPRPRPPAITFDRVTYGYPGRARPAVAGLSLTIPAGARVAIVGPTGAGKSTIVGLLLRFLEPDDGTIRVGPTDLAAIDAAVDWRSICRLPQSPHLFHGTVADTCASPAPTRARRTSTPP
jgi:ATP-binding cassette subfamily C protein CydCD